MVLSVLLISLMGRILLGIALPALLGKIAPTAMFKILGVCLGVQVRIVAWPFRAAVLGWNRGEVLAHGDLLSEFP
jgi:hypothetical protein